LATTWDKATIEGHFGVRTAYSSRLAPLAVRWLRGASKRPPADFDLDGQRLRLWCAAAGEPAEDGWSLHLGAEEECWKPVGTALGRAGLPATLLGVRAGGPLFRIEGRKRVAHLAELVGDPPPDVPSGLWPIRTSNPGGRSPVPPKTASRREAGAGRANATAREAAFHDEPGLFDL